jgi:hypothetical integral membrane protein (TIGR02206 family)
MLLVLSRVQIGSVEHLFPIIIAVLLAVFSIRYSKKCLSKKHQERLLFIFSVLVSLVVIAYHIYRIVNNDYNFKTDLPLYLCSFLAIIIPVFTYYRKYWMYEILLFWVIAGTSQGVITPDIAEGFPSFDYFRYWVAHLGLLGIIFYATFVFKMRPNFKSVFKFFFALQVYLVTIIAINYLLKANYSYLNHKPKSASVLDYFGEWPYYIIIIQLIIIPLFLLIYLPFYLTNKRK